MAEGVRAGGSGYDVVLKSVFLPLFVDGDSGLDGGGRKEAVGQEEAGGTGADDGDVEGGLLLVLG